MKEALWRWFEADGSEPAGTHWHLPCELRADGASSFPSSSSSSSESSAAPQCNPSCFAGLPPTDVEAWTPAPNAHEEVSLVWPRPDKDEARPATPSPPCAVVDGVVEAPRAYSTVAIMVSVLLATAVVSYAVGVAQGQRVAAAPTMQ